MLLFLIQPKAIWYGNTRSLFEPLGFQHGMLRAKTPWRSRRMKKLIFTSVCLTALTLNACQSSAKVDPEIMAALKNVVANCEINVDGNTVTNCKNKERQTLLDMFNKKDQPNSKDKLKSLDTFSVALTSEDKQLGVAASNILYSAFRTFGPVNPEDVPKAAALRLVNAVGQSPKYQAAQALVPTIHAAILSGQEDALYKMMETHSYDAIPGLGFPHIMYYGRMDTFPKVQSLATGPNEKWANAALEAPRNMPQPSDQEKAAICPWVDQELQKSEGEKFYGFGRLALWCKGPAVDTLLTKGEARLAQNQFTRDDYLLFRDVCFSPIKGLIKEAGKQDQCTRNLTLLEKAVNNEKLEGQARGLALFGIYYQRRNADTLALMQKYKDHKVPEIQKYAKESIDSLTTTYKLKAE